MKQRELLNMYSKTAPSFNRSLFKRSDDDLVEAIRKVIYSCERDNIFTIKVLDFEVIDSYEEINNILYEYEENLKRGKKDANKIDNPFAYINLKKTSLKLIRVTYYIKIEEKKNGWVDDTVVTYIAIPRIVNGFYFRINSKLYSAMYQIVDASTYNNSAAKSAKKQSITFKTTFAAIRIYRYTKPLTAVDGEVVPCTYFVINVFKKSILVMKYILAKVGFDYAMRFLHIEDLIVTDVNDFDTVTNYIFPINGGYIVIPKELYNMNQITQSFVYTIYTVANSSKEFNLYKIYNTQTWVDDLGTVFTEKDLSMVGYKGVSVLGSLEFIYDDLSKDDLRLEYKDKATIYHVLRWIMYEFNSHRQKDNLDITTKKVRWAEYIAGYYALKLTPGIYRISDKGNLANLSTIRKAIQIPPMYLIGVLVGSQCQLVNYKSCVNDLDSILALKYTYKGLSGIGEKSNAISTAYRSIHPSHLGRVDIDSSSNSDPGVSGKICPLTQLYDGHFSDYMEPSTWEADLNKAMTAYRAVNGKKEMCRLINDVGITRKANNDAVLSSVSQLTRNLMDFALAADAQSEYINGYDIFGDGMLWYLEE